MSPAPAPPRPDVLTDPVRVRFRVAQRVAALGEGWVRLDAPPEGEVIWCEAAASALPSGGGYRPRLTPSCGPGCVPW